MPSNFRMEEVPMPELPPKGLLLHVLFLSLDPYMRGRMDDAKSYAKSVGVGEVMTGESVCEVIASTACADDSFRGDYREGLLPIEHRPARRQVRSEHAPRARRHPP